MALSAERQRARRVVVRSLEQSYTIEAGTSEGIKYRHNIQFGYDASTFTNWTEVRKQILDYEQGKKFPAWTGSAKRGRFSERTMFMPTWIKVYRETELIHQSGDSL